MGSKKKRLRNQRQGKPSNSNNSGNGKTRESKGSNETSAELAQRLDQLELELVKQDHRTISVWSKFLKSIFVGDNKERRKAAI